MQSGKNEFRCDSESSFDPFDLEMLEAALQDVWSQFALDNPFRDSTRDEYLKAMLRQKLFSYVNMLDPVDADDLRSHLLEGMREEH